MLNCKPEPMEMVPLADVFVCCNEMLTEMVTLVGISHPVGVQTAGGGSSPGQTEEGVGDGVSVGVGIGDGFGEGVGESEIDSVGVGVGVDDTGGEAQGIDDRQRAVSDVSSSFKEEHTINFHITLIVAIARIEVASCKNESSSFRIVCSTKDLIISFHVIRKLWQPQHIARPVLSIVSR